MSTQPKLARMVQGKSSPTTARWQMLVPQADTSSLKSIFSGSAMASA